MTALYVDSDVLIDFQRGRALSSLKALGRLPLCVTEFVWWEVAEDPRIPSPERDAMRNVLETVAGGPTELPLDSDEARDLALLMERFGSVLGDGELSVIACAGRDPDGVAVLADRHALYRAVEEVPKRALSVYGFLGELRQLGAPIEHIEKLARAYGRRKSQLRPLWW